MVAVHSAAVSSRPQTPELTQRMGLTFSKNFPSTCSRRSRCSSVVSLMHVAPRPRSRHLVTLAASLPSTAEALAWHSYDSGVRPMKSIARAGAAIETTATNARSVWGRIDMRVLSGAWTGVPGARAVARKE